MSKIKNFLYKLIPTKRRVIQLYAALLYNANIRGFIKGEIFTGSSKKLCVPGLNCYSCPGAIGACPLGTLQNALAESKTKYPTYILGILLLYSIIFGRFICGWLCPVGLVQELMYKIKTPKLQKSKVTRILSYFKYVLLFLLVIAVPIGFGNVGVVVPGFCKYVCPAGLFEGGMPLLSHPANSEWFKMLGPIFTWKFVLLVGFGVGSIFIYRFFCRFFCPLGALYGLFNKIAILGIKIDKEKCNSCGSCVNSCKMDVKEVGDHECIMCGECKSKCHAGAIDWKLIGKLVKEEKEAVVATDAAIVANQAESKQEANQTDLTDNNTKTNKKLKKKTIFDIILASIMTITLIVTIIVVNFNTSSGVYKIGESVNIEIQLYNDDVYDLNKENTSVLFYFDNEFNSQIIEKLEAYRAEYLLDAAEYDPEGIYSLDIVFVSTVTKKDENMAATSSYTGDIILGHDGKNDNIAGKFVDAKEYPYFVYIDSKDKLVFKQNEIVTESQFKRVVIPSAFGREVGNKEGNICISKNINFIGKDGVFNVSDKTGKIVVINFWYTTCGPCVKELPHFDKLLKKYKDDVYMISIHEAEQYDFDPAGVLKYINKNFSEFDIEFGYDDLNDSYYKAFGGNQEFPMTVIVNQDGIISEVRHGEFPEADLEAKLVSLIGGNK